MYSPAGTLTFFKATKTTGSLSHFHSDGVLRKSDTEPRPDNECLGRGRAGAGLVGSAGGGSGGSENLISGRSKSIM